MIGAIIGGLLGSVGGLMKTLLWLLLLLLVELIVGAMSILRVQSKQRARLTPERESFGGLSFTMVEYLAILVQSFMFIISATIVHNFLNNLRISAGASVEASPVVSYTLQGLTLVGCLVLNWIIARKFSGFVVPGITGGMASGKTTVAEMLIQEGWVSNDADSTYHSLMKKGEPLYDDIVGYFGKGIVGADEEIDRNKLAKAIQDDKSGEGMKKISQISHPQIFLVMLSKLWSRTSLFGMEKPTLMFLDVPLMFETKVFAFLCCPIINIHTPERERMSRFRKRVIAEQKQRKLPRGATMKVDETALRDHFQQMTSNQLQDEERRELSDITLNNDGTISDLQKKVKHTIKFLNMQN